MSSELNETLNLDLRVNRRSVQQEVVEKLRDAILAGVFQPGDRLIEANLCASLGVSRASLREALRSLQAERLIELIPNRGPQIPVLTWKSAEEIYEVRALLEGEAAARCATSIGEDEIASLSVALESFRRAVKSDDAAGKVRFTSEFYAIILRNSGNHIIEQLLQSLLARINFLRARSMSLPGRTKKSYEEMNAILTAIKGRNAKEARKMAQLHVAHAREAAKKAFTEGPATQE
jgi:DNA-binding GntR family transcriptional regulator